jgi:UDP-N-acetylglucosamine 1-carboxyvinyltransferase
MTGGEVEVCGVRSEYLEGVTSELQKMGVKLEVSVDSIKCLKNDPQTLKGPHIETEVYPGFPTDVQAQMMALMTVLSETSSMTETIFENRFMHVPEMIRMGAKIELKGNTAFVDSSQLKAAPVMCTDLRASAALILCALVAQGETVISRVYHLDRGYEDLEEKFSLLGADIQRIRG